MISFRSFKKVCITCATFIAFFGGTILLTGCKTAALIGVIAGAATVVTVVVVAKYKANEQQKAAAAERARFATVALAANPPPKRPAKAPAQPRNKVAPAAADTAVVVDKPKPGQPAVAAIPARPLPTPEEMEEALTHKLPKYLAVPVPKQQIAAEERGEATYMVWNTHKQELMTDDVYVLKHDVRAGVTVKLNGVNAFVASAD
jgi:hypothetical protein